MNHPAELALHQYMENAASGKSTMSVETIRQVSLDVSSALARQFGGGNKRDKFGLRMSNVGSQLVSFGLRRTNQRRHCPCQLHS